MLNSKLKIVKPSRYVFVAVVWAICSVFVNGCASDSLLSRADRKKIGKICPALIHSTLGDAAWQALSPYLIRKDALRHLHATCDEFSCKGSLPLQDGYFIDYWYSNPHVRFGSWRPKFHEVNAVALRHGDKTIDSYSTMKRCDPPN